MREGQNCCNKNNTHADKEQITVARTKQQQEEEEDTGIKPVGGGNSGAKRETRQTKENKQDNESRLATLLPLSRSTL